MKQFYFLFFLLTSSIGFGQCPTGNVWLGSQADVDNFGSTYPTCDNIQGFLIIQGSDIVDLSPLSQLNSVGSISVSQTSLQSMAGLESLTITGLATEDAFVVVDNNPLLQDLLFLNDYTFDVPVVFLIRDMTTLTSLEGASSINEFVTIYLENNDALTDLNGLNQNLNLIGGSQTPIVYISDNAVLSDISRLDIAQWIPSLTAVITGNSQLAVCDNNLVCSLVENEAITIENNAEGCFNIAQVAIGCGLVPSNDECDGVSNLILGETTEAYNESATPSTQVPTCNDSERMDVWFSFDSAELTSVDISVDSDYSLQLWQGTCGSLMPVSNACASNMLSEVVVTPNTNYYLQVWSNGTATGLFDVVVENAALSVEENSFDGFSVYPNPVSNKLNLKSVHTIASVEIYNLIGQSIIMTQPDTLVTSLDLSSFQTGMYILKVIIDNQTETFRIIKE